eukprot:g14603.t1 g14603   contig9:2251482-2253142(-)
MSDDETWREKAAKAKRGHRPSLKNWERDGLYASFPSFAAALTSPSARPYSSFQLDDGEVLECSLGAEEARRRGAEMSRRGSSDHVTTNERTMMVYPVVLDAKETSPSLFHQRYEASCIPVVIRDIPYGGDVACSSADGRDGANNEDAMDYQEEKKECDNSSSAHISSSSNNNKNTQPAWPAIQNWTPSALSNHPTLSDRPLKCGEDDDGYTIRIKLKYFLQYLQNNKDDSPLYIFDATFDEDKYAKCLLDDYTVPHYFNEDLFGLVGEKRRPPYRWFLVGPCRSGTTVHIDPLATSAWNTLVYGVKRWVLFPPHVPKSVVKGRKLILPGEDDEAIHYFTTILPRMKRRAAQLLQVASRGGREDVLGEYANFKCYEFTQFAGETVFIPHGWWHAVLNVTHTIGITQNFCSKRNFDAVWLQTRSGRKKMACTWLRRLKEQYPDLAARAKELNRRDGFVMWEDDPAEQRRWRQKRADKEKKKREKKAKKQAKLQKEKWGEHRTSERK